MGYFLAGGVVIAIGLLMVSPMIFPEKRVKGHAGLPEGVFVAQLAAEGISDEISSAVFRYYKRKTQVKEFSPSPDMVINEVFEEGPEDIDDAAKDLLKELHLAHPSEEAREAYGRDVQTAGDLARWLQWAKSHQPS